MKSISFNQSKSKGFSLVELLIVLGVLAILMVAAFMLYPQVRDRNQANAEVTNLTAIKANINNLYASKGGKYTGLTTEVANNARAFPPSMNGGDFETGAAAGDIAAAWGGAVEVAPATVGTAIDRSFTITYADVPAGVCLGLVSGSAGNFSVISVGGTSVYASGEFDPAAAAGACVAGGAVVFTSN